MRETGRQPKPPRDDRGGRRRVNATPHKHATRSNVPDPKNAPERSIHVSAPAASRARARMAEASAPITVGRNVARGFSPAIAGPKPALSSPFDKLRTSVEGAC